MPDEQQDNPTRTRRTKATIIMEKLGSMTYDETDELAAMLIQTRAGVGLMESMQAAYAQGTPIEAP